MIRSAKATLPQQANAPNSTDDVLYFLRVSFHQRDGELVFLRVPVQLGRAVNVGRVRDELACFAAAEESEETLIDKFRRWLHLPLKE